MDESREGEIIEQIYDLVTCPTNYGDFMHSLHEKMSAIEAGSKERSSTAISGHLKRAVDLLDIVTPWQSGIDTELHRYLSMKMQGVIAVDRNGDIRDANMAARVSYDLTLPATLDQLPISSTELEQLLCAVQNTVSNNPASNRPTNILRLYNIKAERSLLINIEQKVDLSSGDSLAILITSDVGWPNHLGSLLQHLFELTYAEIAVIRLMVEGERVEGIAKRRGSSPTTVRNQLRAIFSKTDTSSQLDCVRMVFGLALMHDAEEGERVAIRIQENAEIIAYPRFDQRTVMRLNNGRELEYSIYGAEDGETVLFYHDQTFGDVWFPEAVAQLVERGLRVVSPLRPGFGHTTVYSGESSEPEDFALDVRALLDHLEVERTALIGMSSGLVHSLAAAALMPERVVSISVGHPILPVLEDADLEGLNGFNYLIPHARLHFPQSIRFLCKAGFAFSTTSGPAAFAKSVVPASPKDSAWLARPENLQTIVEGIHAHRVQGYVGNYGDIGYRKDWRPLLENCPVPVRLVLGEDDCNVQWAAAKRWAAAEAHVSLHVMPESGYFVLHQHANAFLDWAMQDMATKSSR